MNQNEAAGTQVALATDKKLHTLRSMLEGAKDKLQAVAPKYMSAERLARLVLATASRNPRVLECTPASVMLFAMKCCELGLDSIGPGGAWPVPFVNNKTNTVELTLIPDYRGKINVARKIGLIKDVRAIVVYANDRFQRIEGSNPNLIHEPNDKDPGEMIGCYAIITLPDGSKTWEYMRREEIEAIRDRSQAWKGWLKYKKECPWVTDPGEMWKKTVIHRAMKPFQGASPELAAIMDAEQEAEARIEAAIVAPQLLDEGLKATEEEIAKRHNESESQLPPLPGATWVGTRPADAESRADQEGERRGYKNDGDYLVALATKLAKKRGGNATCESVMAELSEDKTGADGLTIQTKVFARKNPGHKIVQRALAAAIEACKAEGVEL